MAVLHDFECADHGVFESTHPICPAFNCECEDIKKKFRPLHIKSAMTKATDAGFRQSADAMGISNFRSARPGEASFGGDRAGEALWGSEINRALGVGTDKPIADVVTGMCDEPGRGTEAIPQPMRKRLPAATKLGAVNDWKIPTDGVGHLK